ncbi:MAG: ABC transporter ATP-binding protein [Chloroflexota bacterium]
MNVTLRGLTYLRPYLRLALGAFVSMLVVTAANLYAPQLVRQLIDNGIEAGSWNGILIATGGLLLVAIVRGLFSFTNVYWSETASQGIAYDLRNEIYTKLETLSFSYHDTHRTGQLMTRTTSDVEGVRNFYAQGLLQLISAVLTFIGSMIILFTTDWRLALASLTTIPVIIGLFVWLFSRMGPLFGTVQRNLGILNNILQESIAGVRVVKAFAAEPRELGRYTDQNEVLYNQNLSVIRMFSLGFPTVFLLANIGTLIVIWYGGNLVISEELSLGTLIAFNSYLAFLLQPIFQLGFLSQQLARADASGKRLFEVIDAENEIQSPAQPIPFAADAPAGVVFENVHFSYAGSEKEILHNISFEVLPGETIALVGATGSGKSSIVNLIPRFYEATDGKVLIDGIDVRDFEVNELRHRVGVALQSISLVSESIKDNIRYGKPEATDEEVIHAAKLAQAHDFIMEQPDRYETMLGEQGSGLSGGQRQRIAIARVLLVHPRILIFDDSMSAVDVETEHKLQEALEPYLDHHTAFIIAQRVSTLRSADKILVIDEGRVAAEGTHDELMHNSHLYAEIVHSQMDDD